MRGPPQGWRARTAAQAAARSCRWPRRTARRGHRMATRTTGGDASRLRWRLPSAQTLTVLAISAALVALTVAAGIPVHGAGPLLDRPFLPWWVMAAGFATTEMIVLHLQVRREAQTVSVSELPLVLGLFFSSPLGLLAGRLAGSAAVLVLHRRSAPLKTLFNLALVSAETALAVLVFRLVAAAGRPLAVDWFGAYGGVLL